LPLPPPACYIVMMPDAPKTSDTSEPFVYLYDTPPPAADELFCPHCGYNLCGTTEDRCSECGEPFDRAALTAWTTTARQPLPFGSLGASARGTDLFRASLFAPSKLGRLLPPYPDPDAVNSLTTRLLAAGGIPFICLMIAAPIGRHGNAFFSILLIFLPILIASVVCEASVAGLLGKWVPARSVPLWNQPSFWRTLCRCFSSHLLVTTTLFWVVLAFVLAVYGVTSPAYRFPATRGLLPWLPYLVPVATVLWWWYCLGRAIAARGAPCAARTIIILLIPVIAIASIVLGIGVGLVEGVVMGGFRC
jgi:hypothetical protein